MPVSLEFRVWRLGVGLQAGSLRREVLGPDKEAMGRKVLKSFVIANSISNIDQYWR
jgi:hypothetical protein